MHHTLVQSPKNVGKFLLKKMTGKKYKGNKRLLLMTHIYIISLTAVLYKYGRVYTLLKLLSNKKSRFSLSG